MQACDIRTVGLHPKELSLLSEPAIRFGLDFDDAYQYEVAKRYDLALVSFDSDFDKTDLQRYLPQELIDRK